jgi:hypothetical protein
MILTAVMLGLLISHIASAELEIAGVIARAAGK